MRSQLRENQKPKVQKPQSKPTENQIAKMSPQTPDLWNWTTENQRAKMGPQTPDLRDHEAYDSSFSSQGWSEAYQWSDLRGDMWQPVTDLRRDWTEDGVVGEI